MSKLSQLLSKEGAIARSLPRFEERSEQQQMAADIDQGLRKGLISLIEAGTGTGKSIAYLLPAAVYALEKRQRVVISTHTIPLQNQLLLKDFPLLKAELGEEVRACLVKGMHNYFCLRKIQDAAYDRSFLQEEEKRQIDEIIATIPDLDSLSDLSFSPSPAVREKVVCERESCTHHRCRFFENCRFFEAREAAENAQILIVNHYLLMADLIRRSEDPEGKGVLPDYQHVIVDEAHHLEAVASESLAQRISKGSLIHLLGRLLSEKGRGGATGFLAVLKQKIEKAFPKGMDEQVADLVYRMQTELFSSRQELLHAIYDTFDEVRDGFKLFHDPGQAQDWKLRVQKSFVSAPQWEETIQEPFLFLIEKLKQFSSNVHAIIEEVSQLRQVGLQDRLEGTRADILAALSLLDKVAAQVETFVDSSFDPQHVRWIEAKQLDTFSQVECVQAHLDVSPALQDMLFHPCKSVTLCSATLTTNGTFQFIRDRLGLNQGRWKVQEKVYPSPFSYKDKVLLGIPTDLPEPQSPRFLEVAVRFIEKAILTVEGNAFVLFTSFFMLNYTYEALQARLEAKGFVLLKQGETSRERLLQRFRSEEKTVLFGTDTFWEGVDVVGDALRCVIITKLPFPVPSEPLIQARMEQLEQANQRSFFAYSVPQAIVKFKQGFGRLIRHKSDQGVIFCLDNRLVTKGYGRHFLESLPSCQRVFASRSEVLQVASEHLLEKNGA